METLKSRVGQYVAELGGVTTLFLLTLTLSALLHRFFDFRLLPPLETGLLEFQRWAHIILSLLVWDWLMGIVNFAWQALATTNSALLSLFLQMPHLHIPPLVTDLSLVSAALTRLFTTTDTVVPRVDREVAEKATTEAQWQAIKDAEGFFWGGLHRGIERTSNGIWALLGLAQSGVKRLVPNNPRVQRVSWLILQALAGAALFWGFLRFAGYVINGLGARTVGAPIMKVRKRFMRSYVLNLALSPGW